MASYTIGEKVFAEVNPLEPWLQGIIYHSGNIGSGIYTVYFPPPTGHVEGILQHCIRPDGEAVSVAGTEFGEVAAAWGATRARVVLAAGALVHNVNVMYQCFIFQGFSICLVT